MPWPDTPLTSGGIMSLKDAINILSGLGLLVLLYLIGTLLCRLISTIYRKARFLLWKHIFEKQLREREREG